MKGWMYILKNEETGRYYVGSTGNLKTRLRQHELGHTRTTRLLGTNKLVYFEEFEDLKDARKREFKLKSYKSKKYIEWLISPDRIGVSKTLL